MSRARRTKEKGVYGRYDAGFPRWMVCVRSLPVASYTATSHGFLLMRTLPKALVYVTALSPFSTRQERSVGTGPASMSDGGPCIIAAGRSRVLSRRRNARGLTKE